MHIQQCCDEKNNLISLEKILKLISNHLSVVRFQFDAPNALMSLRAIEIPCPVRLPGTSKSPKSIGSREGISYSGMPVTSFGFNFVMDLMTQPFKSGSDFEHTCKNDAGTKQKIRYFKISSLFLTYVILRSKRMRIRREASLNSLDYSYLFMLTSNKVDNFIFFSNHVRLKQVFQSSQAAIIKLWADLRSTG